MMIVYLFDILVEIILGQCVIRKLNDLVTSLIKHPYYRPIWINSKHKGCLEIQIYFGFGTTRQKSNIIEQSRWKTLIREVIDARISDRDR